MTPRVEAIGYRDPDGDTDLVVFVDGERVEAECTVVDPSRTARPLHAWLIARDDALAGASPDAAEQIRAFFARGAETTFISSSPS